MFARILLPRSMRGGQRLTPFHLSMESLEQRSLLASDTVPPLVDANISAPSAISASTPDIIDLIGELSALEGSHVAQLDIANLHLTPKDVDAAFEANEIRELDIKESNLNALTPVTANDLGTYRNPNNRFDADGNGRVNPNDVFAVVGYLILNGVGAPKGTTPRYPDVTAPDNMVNPLDVLAIVSHLFHPTGTVASNDLCLMTYSPNCTSIPFESSIASTYPIASCQHSLR